MDVTASHVLDPEFQRKPHMNINLLNIKASQINIINNVQVWLCRTNHRIVQFYADTKLCTIQVALQRLYYTIFHLAFFINTRAAPMSLRTA